MYPPRETYACRGDTLTVAVHFAADTGEDNRNTWLAAVDFVQITFF
jgi:hypothetical protein